MQICAQAQWIIIIHIEKKQEFYDSEVHSLYLMSCKSAMFVISLQTHRKSPTAQPNAQFHERCVARGKKDNPSGISAPPEHLETSNHDNPHWKQVQVPNSNRRV